VIERGSVPSILPGRKARYRGDHRTIYDGEAMVRMDLTWIAGGAAAVEPDDARLGFRPCPERSDAFQFSDPAAVLLWCTTRVGGSAAGEPRIDSTLSPSPDVRRQTSRRTGGLYTRFRSRAEPALREAHDLLSQMQ
jgi:hypothetical protein